jgi:hypothetical protein
MTAPGEKDTLSLTLIDVANRDCNCLLANNETEQRMVVAQSNIVVDERCVSLSLSLSVSIGTAY